MPLGILPEKDFFGRKEKLSFLYSRALELQKGTAQNIFLSGPHGIGKTELLKQLFNNLFWIQEAVAPFYHSVNNALLSAHEFSRDYLTQYICQRIAFDKKDTSLLYREGLPVKGLYSVIEESNATWALEILDRFQLAEEPLDSLRVALSAPYLSALSTGMPVAVMIDNFQRLNNLHMPDMAESGRLTCLFERLLPFRKTQYIISGSQAEIQEMPLAVSFLKLDVEPLSLESASAMFLSILDMYGTRPEAIQQTLISCLGGNPLYISSVAKKAGTSNSSEDEFWKAYVHEVIEGMIHRYWVGVLKSFCPEMNKRKDILKALRRIYHTESPLPQDRIFGKYSSDKESDEKIITALYCSGLVAGEFRVLHPSKDKVAIDVIDCLCMKELEGKSYRDIKTELMERVSGKQGRDLSFEMTIPSTKEAELVAAQCLEQIGKNLNLDKDAIEQLQMAVIEACINAIEHGKGEKLYLRFNCKEDRLEISIESAGSEFISLETGEPFTIKGIKEDIGRGWGIKLMKNFTDSVAFEKTERGTKVVLVKNILRAAKIEQKDSIQ